MFLNSKRFYKPLCGLIVALSLTQCAKDDLDLTKIDPSEEVQRVVLPTTTINISATTGDAELPNGGATRAQAEENGNDGIALTRAAVNLGDDLFPAIEGSELTAHAFFVKIDGTENDNNKRKVAYTTLNWNRITKGGTNQKVKLGLTSNKLELKWINGEAVTMKPGEKWKMCSIIGGVVNEKEIKVPSYNKQNQKIGESTALKPYTYIDFSPAISGNIQRDPNNPRRITMPFVSKWVDVTVTKDNDVRVLGLSHNPIGVLLKVRIKRDETLVPATEHNYTFQSSALSPNGGIAIYNYVDPDEMYTTSVDTNKELNTNNWFWNWDADRHVDNWRTLAAFEYRFTYNSEDYRSIRENSANPQYDEFYVWGMPINAQIRDSVGQMRTDLYRLTKITPRHGGYMLGIERTKNNKTEYGDEWLIGDGPTDTNEWRQYKFSQQQGKMLTVNLGVTKPRSLDGNEYRWRQPLARFSKSYINLWNKGFKGDIDPRYHDMSYSANGKSVKYVPNDPPTDARGAVTYPDNYYLPTTQEMSALAPTIQNREGDYFGFKKDKLYSDINGEAQEYVAFGENLQKYDIALSKYKTGPDGTGILYALRYMYDDKHSPLKKDGPGQRYCTAYRWKFYFNQIAATAPKGERIVVQSRWIGNANVSIDDISNEAYWSNEGYKKLTETRILPNAGSTDSNGRDVWGLSLWTQSQPKPDPIQGSTTYWARTFSYRGFSRSYNVHNSDMHPMVVVYKWDGDENAADAPAQQTLKFGTGADNAAQNGINAAKAQGISPEEYYK